MRTIPLFVALVLSVSCATTAEVVDTEESQDTTNEPITNEKFIAGPPEGWTLVYQTNTPKTRISDFVPPGQTKVEWDTKITFQSHNAEDLPIDPVTILVAQAEEDKDLCETSIDHNVFSGYENNYETSVRLFLCGKNNFNGKGEIRMIKAIRANDFFYSVRITRRTEPFEASTFNRESGLAAEEIAAWSSYFSRMSVCDDTEEHPCPSPN